VQITLPNNWSPRPYQLPVLKYLDAGGKRAVSVWARRHGKDSTAINHTAKAAFQRVGVYWHVYPTLRQARKAIWDGIDKQGRRIIHQAFPGADNPGTGVVRRVREDDMKIELVNNSIWQLVGADNYDALVGSNPVGIVLSEWSLMDPKVWDFLRPIVRENGGWVWFIYTPRGKNHGWDILQRARANPDRWFSEVVDIKTAGVLDVEETIREEREDGMPEELIQQEYFCSFDIGVVGAVYANQINRAEEDARITEIPYDPNFPVETAWDIGHRDSTSIWFIQRVGFQVRVIDYYENRGVGLQHYINVVNSKPYAYARHIGPWDLEQHHFSAGAMGEGATTKQVAEQLGLQFVVAPKLLVADGINAGRALLSKAYFDKNKTADGLKALKAYHFEWDDDKKIFTKDPVHDWSSHAADAWRTYAVAPELEFMMPQWLKDMSPVFGGRVPAAQEWNPKTGKPGVSTSKSVLVPDKHDPLAAFRGR
jgi:phage terminase large subunit